MIQPGQINYYKQLQDLNMVPPSAEGVSYLQQLANNPSSPFVKFLVESRLEQITKALNNQKGDQTAPPQGTIKDKIEQSAGIAALQAAQQRQAAQAMQHPQPGAPVPEGAPHPITQGEPERERGIASAPVDESMFNFAPGGIVAFAGGNKVTDEEKEKLRNQTKAYIEAAQQKAAEEAAAANVDDRTPRTAANYDINPVTDETVGMGTPPARVNPLSAALSGIGRLLGGRPPQSMMLDTSEAPAMSPVGAPKPPAPTVAAPVAAPTAAPTAPVTAPITAPVAAAPAPAAPRVPGGIAGPAPSALMGPPAPPTGLDAAMQKAIAAPKDITTLPGYSDYKTAQDKLMGEIKPETKVEDDIAKRLELYKSLGIGKSDEVAEKLIKDRAARYEKTQKARDMNNFMDQLADYATPGANWSNVVKGEQARRAQQMTADEIFAQEQDKMTLEVIKNKEARTMGALGDVIKEAADKSKNRLEAIKAIATNAAVPLQQATQLYDAYIRSVGTAWSTALNVAAQDRATASHERVGMAQVGATREATAMRGDIAGQKLEATLAGLDIKQKALLNNNPVYKNMQTYW